MAKPTTLRWTKLSVWLGDGASPEDFTSAVCGMTARNFGINAEASESVVPDCDDPDAPAFVERVIRSLSSGISGEGLLAAETFATWRAWALSGLPKNVRVVLDLPSAAGYFEGRYVLTSFQLNGNESEGKVGVSIELASDGEFGWAVGAP